MSSPKRRIPEWLCDFKPDNYGMLNGRFVCRDYGLSQGSFSGKMVKRQWRAA